MDSDSRSEGPDLAPVSRELRDGRTSIVITRQFAHDRERVWDLLSDPELLRLWAPYAADRNLSTVGKVVFTMLGDNPGEDIDVSGVVLISDGPVSLEHSWATDVLAWRLDPTDGGCRLTLRHTLADPAMASAAAAGWHLCFDVAEAVLDGRPTAPVRGMAALDHGWTELNERYAVLLGVEPSRI